MQVRSTPEEHKSAVKWRSHILTSDENRARKEGEEHGRKWSVRCGYLRDMMKASVPQPASPDRSLDCC